MYQQTSGTASNTDLLVNRTETAIGSGTQLLIDAQVGGVSKFNVDHTGSLKVAGNSHLFGTNSSSATTTPLNVSFGGTYGTNTPGSAGNLKWIMYNDGGDGTNFYGMENECWHHGDSSRSRCRNRVLPK